jgi:hypothetical protein
MPTDPDEHPAPPEQPHGGFAEGEDDPEKHPRDNVVGRFGQTDADLTALSAVVR